MTPKSNIYTRGGDKGTTSLVSGNRVEKDNPRIETYGTIDELNSSLGLLASLLDDPQLVAFIHAIQNKLFDMGAYLATDPDHWTYNAPMPLPGVDADDIAALEHQIDLITEQLPPLKHFILPGGTTAAATAQLTRTVCRRAERLAVALARQTHIAPQCLIFLNRLSDYLFVVARFINLKKNHPEIIWQKDCKLP